jgi:ribokinase
MTSEGSSGVAVIAVARSGENSIVIVPGANALLTSQDLDANMDALRSAGMVLAQLEIPLETVEHLAKICMREGVPLMLDPAPARELPKDLYQAVDWFTPNETEAAFFLDRCEGDGALETASGIAKVLMAKGAKGVALKMGSRGAYLASTGGLDEVVSAFSVQAIDTTAAGDCFNGAFATGLLMKMTAPEAAQFAAAAAAISVTRAGAQPSMPTLAEVELMLSRA